MACIYRDFTIPGHTDPGNIRLSFVEEGIICLRMFGLHYGYCFAVMRIRYPPKKCLYETCIIILNTMTENFKEVTYAGYKDYIFIHPEETEILKEHEFLSSHKKTCQGYIEIDCFDANIDYLKIYNIEFDFALSPPYKLQEGVVTDDGKFIYDHELLLHCEDDFSPIGTP